MDNVDAVNAYSDDGDSVIVALRVDGEWRAFRLARTDADTLAGMLALLSRPTEGGDDA